MRQFQILENRLDTQCLLQVGIRVFSLYCRQTRATTALLHLGMPKTSPTSGISKVNKRSCKNSLKVATLQEIGWRLFVLRDGADVWRFKLQHGGSHGRRPVPAHWRL